MPALLGGGRRRASARLRSSAGCAASKVEHAVEIGRKRAVAGIDVEVDAGAVAVRRPGPRRCETDSACPCSMKLPSPRTEPASERTSPLKAISFSSSVRAAGRIVQGDAAGEIEPVDRQRAQIDRAGRMAGQSIRPLASRPEIERQAVDRQFGGAHLAAHQRAQAEFDASLSARTLTEIVGAADRDRVQLQRRRRQQPRVELAAAADRRADDPGRLRPRTAAGTGSSR